MESIKEVLMRRDGITAEDADEQIAEAREVLSEYLNDGNFLGAEDVCAEMFGLEPDYLMELMGC